MRKYTLEEKINSFWGKVAVDENEFACWNWIGAREPIGYGNFNLSCFSRKAHRVAYMLAFGDCPPSLDVCHHCDNPSCVNPNHLFLGTALDNVQDSVLKGRRAKQAGQENHNHKLTKVQVDEIRRRYKEGGVFQKDLAAEYGMSFVQINKIIRNIAWKD